MSNIYNFDVRVYYEDTDVGGIVYYANYLKFFERARTEMIYSLLGLNHKKLKIDCDIIFIVRSCNIKYLKPAEFEDKLNIQTKIIKKTPVRINLLQEVRREEALLVSAEIELAVINHLGSVSKLPSNLFNKLK